MIFVLGCFFYYCERSFYSFDSRAIKCKSLLVWSPFSERSIRDIFDQIKYVINYKMTADEKSCIFFTFKFILFFYALEFFSIMKVSSILIEICPSILKNS